jgi:hypothetical protein
LTHRLPHERCDVPVLISNPPALARPLQAERQARQKLAKVHAREFGVISQTRKTLDRTTSLRAKLLAEKAERKQAKVLAGLRGQKVGGHEVMRGGDMDVQLGDELSESWRQLEPEGNLFRDRFASLQHRALVEPRKPQTGKRKLNKHKSYEKHRPSLTRPEPRRSALADTRGLFLQPGSDSSSLTSNLLSLPTARLLHSPFLYMTASRGHP